jgi:hypothetical protein
MEDKAHSEIASSLALGDAPLLHGFHTIFLRRASEQASMVPRGSSPSRIALNTKYSEFRFRVVLDDDAREVRFDRG